MTRKLIISFVVLISIVAGQNTKPTIAPVNINYITSWYSNDGRMEESNNPTTYGLTYPFDAAAAVYSSGLIWGGYANDIDSGRLVVNGQVYISRMLPGAIFGLRTGVVQDTGDAKNRIWRIRRDYSAANLLRDAADVYRAGIMNEVTSDDLHDLRARYKKDWEEWPVELGAPFYDADNDGKYTPRFVNVGDTASPILFPDADEPGLQDADQVVWYVCNDVKSPSPFQSQPLGIEEQVTIWGYNKPSDDALGSTLFKRIALSYKGLASTPDSAVYSKAFIAHWTDVDLGNPGDDFAGCDSVYGIGYVYNSQTLDKEYQKYFATTPSIGYVLLQGPVVKGEESDSGIAGFKYVRGAKNIPMTSFLYHATGGLYADPPFNTTGAVQYYNILNGRPPAPTGPPMPPVFLDIITKKPQKFWGAGDPITQTGWVDGIQEPAGDRRFIMVSGPFDMKIGESQEIIYAVVGGKGSDRLASVQVMKLFVRKAIETFKYGMVDFPTTVDRNQRNPQDYTLLQNYPNPFNPTTTIEYQIPNDGFVSLKVCDVLGREAAVLVGEQKSSGRYSVKWNGTGFASGVYFFQLRAGTFVQTRKMVMMK